MTIPRFNPLSHLNNPIKAQFFLFRLALLKVPDYYFFESENRYNWNDKNGVKYSSSQSDWCRYDDQSIDIIIVTESAPVVGSGESLVGKLLIAGLDLGASNNQGIVPLEKTLIGKILIGE